MDAPKPGPSEREIRKYGPPLFTGVFVEIAEMESPVATAMLSATSRMPNAPATPRLPTIVPRRMNITTPRMVRMDGRKTPLNVLKLYPFAAGSAVGSFWSVFIVSRSFCLTILSGVFFSG